MGYIQTGVWKWAKIPYSNYNSFSAQAFRIGTSPVLMSANLPLIYELVWYKSDGSITEGVEASANNSYVSGGNVYGDVVNTIFEVYMFTGSWAYNNGALPIFTNTTIADEWRFIGSIKKARDISNRHYSTGAVPDGHRFTVDISEMIKNELSYSLCPINRGTWRSNMWGGLNGGLVKQDNVSAGNTGNPVNAGFPVSNYNVTPNPTYGSVRIAIKYEIVDSSGFLHTTTNYKGVTPTIVAYNGALTVGEELPIHRAGSTTCAYTVLGQYNSSKSSPKVAMTFCPNHKHSNTTINKEYTKRFAFKKPVRIKEQAEWFNFFLGYLANYAIPSGSSTYTWMYYEKVRLKLELYNYSNALMATVYLEDFAENLTDCYGTSAYIHKFNYTTCVQNISPHWINNNGKNVNGGAYLNTITDDTDYYTVHLEGVRAAPHAADIQLSDRYYFEIDREKPKVGYATSMFPENSTSVDFVRLHWLNRKGGIDSFTLKKDRTEGLNINKESVTRKGIMNQYMQSDKYEYNPTLTLTDSQYISDTMRGANFYQGGKEVINIDAQRIGSVYSEPLNVPVAKWLEEILTSPNVWIEKETEYSDFLSRIPKPHPSTHDYFPIIITNSDVLTVNEEQGLVKFNIEYTYSYDQATQSN